MNKHLWQPTEKKVQSQFRNFVKFVNFNLIKNLKIFGMEFQVQKIFWSKFWDYSKIIGDKGQEVIRKNKVFNKTKFFPDSKNKLFENILKKKIMILR